MKVESSHYRAPHISDVDIFKKSISIQNDTFENLYRYVDIISTFLKRCR